MEFDIALIIFDFSVPFEFCDPPPPVSHGFMATPPENAYTILSEVRYQCHPGYHIKSIATLKCHSTGCWTPLELPQCIREDIYRKQNYDDLKFHLKYYAV